MDLPVIEEDIFSREAIRDARAVDDALREAGPAVYIAPHDIVVIGRFEDVSTGLSDWERFSSTSRPFHDPDSPRPELLLVDDPPKHTRVRAVIAQALSPRALKAMDEAFKIEAERRVERLVERAGETVDAVDELVRPFVMKVLPDLLGLPEAGRENINAFGAMVWATLGPENDLFQEIMQGSGPVMDWVERYCERGNLAEGSLGAEMFAAADRGEVSEAEAKLLIQILLSAAADTTILTVATALKAFCEAPDQWDAVRADPTLIRAAFEESLRWDSPSRMAGRITTQEVQIDGATIAAGTRCGLLFGAANRDPRRWSEPDRFDVHRRTNGHVGFGYGIHACVGRTLAQMEAHALLGALARRVERIEAAGPVEPLMATIARGPAHLPVRITPALA